MTDPTTPPAGGEKPSRSRRSHSQEQPEAPQTHEQTANDDRSEEEIQEELGLAPGPEQPEEVVIFAEDRGTVINPMTVRDGDVDLEQAGQFEAGSAQAIQEAREKEREEREGDIEPITGEQVELLQSAQNTNGFALMLNGTVYMFSDQMTGSLKQAVDRAVVGLAL